MPITRVNTGVKGLNDIIEQGFPESSPILLSGSPGAGKTLTSLQFLYHGAQNNEPGIYITFEEPKESILTAGKRFGWEFSEYIKNNKLVIVEYFELGNEAYMLELDKLRTGIRELAEKKGKISGPMELEEIEIKMADYQSRIHQIEDLVTERRYKLTQHEREQEFLDRLRQLVHSIGAKRLVIDSLSAYTIYDSSRESLHRFIRRIRDLKTTTLLISELPKGSDSLSRDGLSEFVCDGVVLFTIEHSREATYRKVRVEKMRYTRIDGREKFLWFTDSGLEVKERPQVDF